LNTQLYKRFSYPRWWNHRKTT